VVILPAQNKTVLDPDQALLLEPARIGQGHPEIFPLRIRVADVYPAAFNGCVKHVLERAEEQVIDFFAGSGCRFEY
jgi:hypothetical protein